MRSRSSFALKSPPLAPLKAASPFALGKRARDTYSIPEPDDEHDELDDEARLPPGQSDPADEGGQGRIVVVVVFEVENVSLVIRAGLRHDESLRVKIARSR